MYKLLDEHHVQIFLSLTGQRLVPPRKSTLQTLYNGIPWNGVRNILVEQGHKVWWILTVLNRSGKVYARCSEHSSIPHLGVQLALLEVEQ